MPVIILSISMSSSDEPWLRCPPVPKENALWYILIIISVTDMYTVNVTRICDKLVTKLNWTMFLNKSQRNLPRSNTVTFSLEKLV